MNKAIEQLKDELHNTHDRLIDEHMKGFKHEESSGITFKH